MNASEGDLDALVAGGRREGIHIRAGANRGERLDAENQVAGLQDADGTRNRPAWDGGGDLRVRSGGERGASTVGELDSGNPAETGALDHDDLAGTGEERGKGIDDLAVRRYRRQEQHRQETPKMENQPHDEFATPSSPPWLL